MMDEVRFKRLAETYGGDISRWPEAEREPARAFAADHAELSGTLLAEAAALDQLLASAGGVDARPSLEDAIGMGAPAVGRPVMRQPSPRWTGVAAAITLTLGAGLGWASAPAPDPFNALASTNAFSALESAEGLDAINEEDAR